MSLEITAKIWLVLLRGVMLVLLRWRSRLKKLLGSLRRLLGVLLLLTVLGLLLGVD